MRVEKNSSLECSKVFISCFLLLSICSSVVILSWIYGVFCNTIPSQLQLGLWYVCLVICLYLLCHSIPLIPLQFSFYVKENLFMFVIEAEGGLTLPWDGYGDWLDYVSPFLRGKEKESLCKKNWNMLGRSIILLLLIWYGSLNMGKRVKMYHEQSNGRTLLVVCWP